MPVEIHLVTVPNRRLILGYQSTTPGYFTDPCTDEAAWRDAAWTFALSDEDLQRGLAVLRGEATPDEHIDLERFGRLYTALYRAVGFLRTPVPKEAPLTLTAQEVRTLTTGIRFLREIYDDSWAKAGHGFLSWAV